MATPLPALPIDAAERRRADRSPVVIARATARGHGDAPAEAALIDLSIYGCRLSLAAPPAAGARLWLRLDGGWPIAATVMWAHGGRMGCRFDAPIATEVMRRFTRLQPDHPARQARSASA